MTDQFAKHFCWGCADPHVGAPCFDDEAALQHIIEWNADCIAADLKNRRVTYRGRRQVNREQMLEYMARHGRDDLQAVAASASTSGIDDGHASITAANVGADTGPAVATPSTLLAPSQDDDGGHGRPLRKETRGALLDCLHESMLPAAMLQTDEAWCPTCMAWRGFGVSL